MVTLAASKYSAMGVPQPATGSPLFPLPEFFEVESPQTKIDGLFAVSCAWARGRRVTRAKAIRAASLVFMARVSGCKTECHNGEFISSCRRVWAYRQFGGGATGTPSACSA